MTAQDDPYVRVYYRIVSDPKFAEVYSDDRRLAAWMRLLLVADGTYPAPAPIPRRINAAAFRHLVDVGLVDLVGPDHYLMHGMAAERGHRSELAKAAAEERWRKQRGNAQQDAPAMRPHSVSNAGAEQHAYAPPMHSERSSPNAPIHSERETRTNGELSERQKVGDAMRDASGLHFPMDSRNGDRLSVMVKRDGVDRVLETIRKATQDMGGYPDQSALVNTVANYLNTPLSGKRETPAQREEREMRDRQSKLNAEAAARRAPQGVA